MELKDQIRIARESNGLDQKKLAELVGVSKQAVIWWEDGMVPRPARLRKLEAIFKISLNVTGGERDGSLPAIQGLKPEHVTLAVMISRLPKERREALITIVKGLSASDQKGVAPTAERGQRKGVSHAAEGEFRQLTNPSGVETEPEGRDSTADRAVGAARTRKVRHVIAARATGRK